MNKAVIFGSFHLGKERKHPFEIKPQITMLKTLILSLHILTTDTLPPANQLLSSIDSFYQVKTQAELLEYQNSKKGEWLKYLPTVGIQYTLDGKPRPTLSFSSSIVYRAKKDKHALVAKRRAIIEKNRLEAQKTKEVLQEMLDEYYVLSQELTARKELLEIDSLLFLIDQKQYDKLEMAPSEFLKAKKTYLQHVQAFRKHRNELFLLRRKILAFSRIGDYINSKSLPMADSPDY